jgi:hypothetical protein
MCTWRQFDRCWPWCNSGSGGKQTHILKAGSFWHCLNLDEWVLYHRQSFCTSQFPCLLSLRFPLNTCAWSFVSKWIAKFKIQLKIKCVEINKPTLLNPHMPLQTSPWSRGRLQVRATSCLWRHARIGKSEAKGWQAFPAIH